MGVKLLSLELLFFLLSFLLTHDLYVSGYSHYKVFPRRRCHANSILSATSTSASTSSEDATLLESIVSMRGTQIKAALLEAGVSTRGVFEKQELALLLYRQRLDRRSAQGEVITRNRENSAPLLDISLDAALTKKYSGVDLVVNGRTIRCIVDTGATVNLLKSSAAAACGLNQQAQNMYTSGFGGGGAIATTKVSVRDAALGGTTVSFEASILTNDRLLPPNADGLLGLSFLRSLGGVADFDFERATLSWAGQTSDLPGATLLSRGLSVRTQTLPAGLLVAEVFLNGAPCVGMLDLGSTYTIASSLAVQSAGARLDQLAASPVICAGIDGRPLPMKLLPSCAVQLGSRDAPRTTLDVYAADVPGLREVGLGALPALIIGVDLLRKRRLIIDLNNSKIVIL